MNKNHIQDLEKALHNNILKQDKMYSIIQSISYGSISVLSLGIMLVIKLHGL